MSNSPARRDANARLELSDSATGNAAGRRDPFPAWLDELRADAAVGGDRAVGQAHQGREHKACCPFHSEKTPSFTANDDKGFYHCFGCQAHGDAIPFLTDARGLPFMEAVKELAAKAGMEVPAAGSKGARTAKKAPDCTRLCGSRPEGVRRAAGRRRRRRGTASGKARGDFRRTETRFGLAGTGSARKVEECAGKVGNDKLIDAGLLICPRKAGRRPTTASAAG